MLTSISTAAALVVGASGGIGAALADAIQCDGSPATVLRLSRASDPGFDLADEASIAAASDRVRGQLADAGAELRLAIVATGFLHDRQHRPEKSVRELEAAHFAKAFAINATGPALLMKHLLPLMPREGRSVFAVLSAKVGSIGDNRLGGWHAYRASKAALNQIVRTVAVEEARRAPGRIVVALHPGTVETGLSAPFSRSGLQVVSPDIAARRLLAVIGRLTAADTGGFFSHDGSRLPW